MTKNKLNPYMGYGDLTGKTVAETKHCDDCENCDKDCQKLILPEGKHICVI